MAAPEDPFKIGKKIVNRSRVDFIIPQKPNNIDRSDKTLTYESLPYTQDAQMTRFSTFHAYFRGSTFGGITSPTEKLGGPKPSVGWLDNATIEPKKNVQTIKPKTSREQFKTTSFAGKTNGTEPIADS